MNDVIAENFMKTDFPSYGYQVVCNATTLCEDWDGPNPEHPVMSQNHFMLGAAEEWFYQVLAGIRVNACDPIHIEPYFAEQADWVDCETLTPCGQCRVPLAAGGGRAHPRHGPPSNAPAGSCCASAAARNFSRWKETSSGSCERRRFGGTGSVFCGFPLNEPGEE